VGDEARRHVLSDNEAIMMGWGAGAEVMMGAGAGAGAIAGSMGVQVDVGLGVESLLGSDLARLAGLVFLISSAERVSRGMSSYGVRRTEFLFGEEIFGLLAVTLGATLGHASLHTSLTRASWET
jgi:hypothetical protein